MQYIYIIIQNSSFVFIILSIYYNNKQLYQDVIYMEIMILELSIMQKNEEMDVGCICSTKHQYGTIIASACSFSYHFYFY